MALLDDVILLKDEAEIERLRLATAAGDYGYACGLAAIKPGVTENHIAGVIEKAIRDKGSYCLLYTSDTMDEELVYNITKSMFEHKDELDAIHAAWKDTNEKTAAVNCPFPLHPGAERYYKEAGFEISILP